MKSQIRLPCIITCVLILFISGCGGGSAAGPGGGGDIIDRSGRSIGTINGFSSVIVNEVTYDVTGATITVDNQPAQQSDLAVGQVVVIEGLVNPDGVTGVADSITTDPSLRGEITGVDLTSASFILLGTRVNVVTATLFDSSIQPADLMTLMVGDVVEVHGYADADGNVTATLIKRSTDTESEIKGRVADLNTDARTFTVNTQLVDYSSASLSGFATDIANGDPVKVEGNAFDGATLLADQVELETDGLFSASDEDTEAEVEGLVTRFLSTADFDIGGVSVTTNATTAYEGGTAGDIALNVHLEVGGVINASGVLVADEVKFERVSNLELMATVEAVNAASNSITMLGITFTTDASTSLIDESDADIQQFSLQDVVVGDFIKAKAVDENGTAILTLLKRINPEGNLKIEGAVTAIAEPSVFIGDAQINTDGATRFKLDDVDLTSTEFFATLAVGDRINAEGQSPQDGVLLARDIERE